MPTSPWLGRKPRRRRGAEIVHRTWMKHEHTMCIINTDHHPGIKPLNTNTLTMQGAPTLALSLAQGASLSTQWAHSPKSLSSYSGRNWVPVESMFWSTFFPAIYMLSEGNTIRLGDLSPPHHPPLACALPSVG